MSEWVFDQVVATPRELHELGVPDNAQPVLRHCVANSSALVLGSTQNEDVVNVDVANDLGIDVVKRRSGGGAVLVEPGEMFWLDVFVPAQHRLWNGDVGRATHWVGEFWQRLLTHFEIESVVHTGAMMRAEFAKSVCFAGLGPGECQVGSAKVVGISQRRTRAGALFQCSIYRRFDVERHRALLNLGADDCAQLKDAVFTVGEIDESELVSAAHTELSRA